MAAPDTVQVRAAPAGTPERATALTRSDPSVSARLQVTPGPKRMAVSSLPVVEPEGTTGASATAVTVTGRL